MKPVLIDKKGSPSWATPKAGQWINVGIISSRQLSKKKKKFQSYHHIKEVCVWLAKSLQSCPTLCNPMDRSLPGPYVHGILQARILEWLSISSFRGSSQPKDQTWVSYVSCIDRQVLSNSKARMSYHLFESLNFFQKCFIVFSVAVLYFFIKFISFFILCDAIANQIAFLISFLIVHC